MRNDRVTLAAWAGAVVGTVIIAGNIKPIYNAISEQAEKIFIPQNPLHKERLAQVFKWTLLSQGAYVGLTLSRISTHNPFVNILSSLSLSLIFYETIKFNSFLYFLQHGPIIRSLIIILAHGAAIEAMAMSFTYAVAKNLPSRQFGKLYYVIYTFLLFRLYLYFIQSSALASDPTQYFSKWNVRPTPPWLKNEIKMAPAKYGAIFGKQLLQFYRGLKNGHNFLITCIERCELDAAAASKFGQACIEVLEQVSGKHPMLRLEEIASEKKEPANYQTTIATVAKIFSPDSLKCFVHLTGSPDVAKSDQLNRHTKDVFVLICHYLSTEELIILAKTCRTCFERIALNGQPIWDFRKRMILCQALNEAAPVRNIFIHACPDDDLNRFEAFKHTFTILQNQDSALKKFEALCAAKTEKTFMSRFISKNGSLFDNEQFWKLAEQDQHDYFDLTLLGLPYEVLEQFCNGLIKHNSQITKRNTIAQIINKCLKQFSYFNFYSRLNPHFPEFWPP